MAKPPVSEMPFLDHLEELRMRIFWALGAVLVGVIIAFTLITNYNLVVLLERPILPYLDGQKLVYTAPGDAFKIVMMLSFVFGCIFALPVVLYQVWAFLSPALYKHEKKMVIPVLMGAAALFLAGVCVSFFIIMPLILGFLMGFQTEAFEAMITARDYFGFAMSMSVAFGVVFELPIAVLVLTALGLVTPELLNRYRRHAVVSCILVAAFITPGADPTSLLVISVPLYLLFEASVGISAIVARIRRRKAAAAAVEADAEEVPA